jgi:S1-C subfamily serine protease
MPDPIGATPGPPPARRIQRPGARARRLGLFGAGVIAAFLAVASYWVLFPAAAPLTQRDVTDSIAQALASQTPGPALSQSAYAAVQPSLVLIETELGAGGAASPGATASPGGAASPGATGATAGLGSGVIIDAAGDILTSLHVVADATTIHVTFADGTRSTARISVRQPDQDIAVLQADQPPATIQPATLGDPRSMRIGSEAYVVGNPFGLDGSLSAGVVSGLDRAFQMPNGGPVLHGLIQVDAAVNPGDSGGPLVDRNGRVVGIVTGLVNPTKQDVFVGIGLAGPSAGAARPAPLPQY